MKKSGLKTKSKNLDVDIELLKSYILNSSSQTFEENNITSFESGDKIYSCTNEDLFIYPNLNTSGKRVLSVTASGDHILNAVLNGAKEVVGFDINRFCKYYSALKIAMIKKYDFYEFFDKLNFTSVFDENYTMQENTQFGKILSDVSPLLTEEERIFWITFNKLIKTNNLEIDFFNCEILGDDIYNLPWVVHDKYLALKEKLINKSCNIKYVDSNIDRLKDVTKGKFNEIYISNILGRMNGHTDYKKMNLLLYLKQLLKKEGIIYSYDFWGSRSFEPSEEFEEHFDILPNEIIDDKTKYSDSVRIYKKK